MKAQISRTGALVVCIAGLLWARTAQADQAIVVGVNKYEHIIPDNWLKGCVNDADLMEGVLHQQGFTVHKLVDEKATHQGIMEQLRQVGKSIKPQERFFFFFAGHGGQLGYLITYDATMRGDKALKSDELKEMVLQIPAVSRTVMLDACHSESLITTRGLKDPDTKTRAIRLEGIPEEATRASEATLSVDEGTSRDVPANGKPGNGAAGREKPKDDANIFYWTAAMRTEKADESVLPDLTTGKNHGVFTYYAAEELRKGGKTWGDMNDDVRKAIEKTHQQNPVITQSFARTVALQPRQVDKANGGAPLPPALPALTTVWDAFNHEHFNANALQLKSEPFKSVVVKDQSFNLSLDAGFDGYLVVMDMDDNGEVSLAFPDVPEGSDKIKIDVEKAKIKAGKNLSPWPGSPTMDTPGRFQVRAILFHSPVVAAELLKQFEASRILKKRDDKGNDTGLATRHLRFKNMAANEYYTADLLFQVDDSVKPAKHDAL